MRRTSTALSALALAAVSACTDPTAVPAPSLALVGPDAAEFVLRGASYGPNGEEITSSRCSSGYGVLYNWVYTENVWYSSGGDEVKVTSASYDQVGCAIGTGGGGGDNIVGGEVALYVDGDSGGSHGANLLADQSAEATVRVTSASTTTITLYAAPWDGFRFHYWTITNASGTQSRRVYNQEFTLPGTTSDYQFHATFIGE